MICSLVIVVISLTGSCSSHKVQMDPISQEFFEYARLFMTKQEKNIFEYLPDKISREEFIQDYWNKRDPNPETEENEFRDEFYNRIEYANQRFNEGISGWKTDRGRIYIFLGPPDKVDIYPWVVEPTRRPEARGLIYWGYYRYRLGIEFIDTVGNGSYKMSAQAGAAGGLLEVIDRMKFGQIYADQAGYADIFRDFSFDYDKESQSMLVLVPVKAISLLDEAGSLTADFSFEFYLYQQNGTKIDQFQEQRQLRITEEELVELDELRFAFPYELEKNSYYVDIIVTVLPDGKKIRKIFEFKI